jgi:RNA polymerase sigma-70 factor (ECF subfamily)
MNATGVGGGSRAADGVGRSMARESDTKPSQRVSPSIAGSVAKGPAFAGRDRRAFTRLILEHDERLRSLAYRLLGDRDLMDDVLQEVYTKGYAALPAFRRRSSAGTWLYRITYTTCIDVLRKQRRFSALPDELLQDVPDTAPDPADELAERERLSVALAALPPEQRAAVLLVDREGFDYKTVAEILDIPFGTAASRVSAARHALRRALGSVTAEGTR